MTETSNTKRGWRIARRFVVAVAVLVTLVALFYAEEDWRGKRAWEQCKAELEARGAVLDWNAYVPPPVPDDQNFLKAPGINEADWVGRGSRDLNNSIGAVPQGSTNPLVVAELTIVSSSQTPGANAGDHILRLDDPAVRKEGERLIREALGPSLTAARLFSLVARPLDQIKPAKAIIVSDKVPAAKDLLALFPETIESSHPKIEPASSNSFRVLLNPGLVVAGDYLRSTDPLEAEFDVIRAALERPYVRFDGDYSEPTTIPIPNFITLRTLAQTLADRTKCCLLLGQPDKALRDLTLLEDICRVTEAKPSGKPMTLVAAMTHVAITGLYADTIADGFRLHAWREGQLIALQEQLGKVHLLPDVQRAFEMRPAALCRTLESTPLTRLSGLFKMTTGNWMGKFVPCMPRGFLYQNMAVIARLESQYASGINLTNNTVAPEQSEGLSRARNQLVGTHATPYNFLATALIPNPAKGKWTLAYYQSKVNLAFVACALERYRLAHGSYPERLDALVPQIAEKNPNDVIGGRPLKYRQNDDGRFVLYSVGWNEKDDGGQVVLDENGKPDPEKGDWVWQPAK